MICGYAGPTPLISDSYMRDITKVMNNYRECARNLWNTYFRTPATTMEQMEAAFRFDEINYLLFNELVLAKIGKLGFKKKSKDDAWPFLRIILPKSAECQVLVSRTSADRNSYWDEPINRLTGNGSKLLLVDYFDWDEFGYLNYSYYKVKLISCSQHPQLVGRQALIETYLASVVYEE